MTLLVVDASVAAKWFLPASSEPFAQEATQIFERWRQDQVRLMVPDHFWAELGAVLWKAVRQGRVPPDLAETGIRGLRALELPAVSCADLIETALSIALAHQRTVYDSLYVALALRSHAEMVTADERLVNALAPRFPVRWLGLFSTT